MTKIRSIYFICIFSFLAGSGLAQSNGDSLKSIQKDTIEFSLRWDFIGDCGKDCNKFLGTGDVLKINGKSIGQNCHHIFVKCPSKLALHRNRVYRFVTTRFIPNNCSTIIDTCTNSITYLLVKELN